MTRPLCDDKLPPSVLIVDDEAAICDIVSRWLAGEGYRCATAADVPEALSVLESGDFFLLISDITMPGQSGLDLLALAHERYPDVAVIIATAVDDRSVAIRALQSGAYGYLIKPFDKNEVLINVANALERRRLVLAGRDYQLRLEEEVRERTADVRRREEEIALRLVWAAEYRDLETGAHIRRIGLYSAVLAEALGWDRQAIDDLKVAAPMHDVGKIGVPDGILLKPERLESYEFDILKKHTEIGAAILSESSIPLMNMAREIALCHHERWDGSGYPRGLVGEQIPESARIVAIADVYDALLHKRVYKPAISEERAVEAMVLDCGKQFDPRIFRHFLQVLPQFRQIRLQWADERQAVQPANCDNLKTNKVP